MEARYINLFDKKTHEKVSKVLVDVDVYEQIKDYTYFLDPRKKQAFRVDSRSYVYLHREVMGFVPGDGRTVKWSNQNYLDCRRSNLVEGTKRVSRKKGLRWPRRFDRLVSQLRKAKHTEAASILDSAKVVEFNRNVFSIELEERYRQNNTVIQKALRDLFGFEGRYFVSFGSTPTPSTKVESVDNVVPLAPKAPTKGFAIIIRSTNGTEVEVALPPALFEVSTKTDKAG